MKSTGSGLGKIKGGLEKFRGYGPGLFWWAYHYQLFKYGVMPFLFP